MTTSNAGKPQPRFRRPSAAPTVPLQFRAPPALHTALTDLAREQGKSLNQTMVDLLSAAMEQRRKEDAALQSSRREQEAESYRDALWEATRKAGEAAVSHVCPPHYWVDTGPGAAVCAYCRVETSGGNG